jgi:hypothetical protein
VFVLQLAVFFTTRYTEYTIFVREFRELQQREAKMLFQTEKQLVEQQNTKILDNNGNEVVITDEMIQDAVDKVSRESTPSFITFYRAMIEETEWSSIKNNNKPFKFEMLRRHPEKWEWKYEINTDGYPIMTEKEFNNFWNSCPAEDVKEIMQR